MVNDSKKFKKIDADVLCVLVVMKINKDEFWIFLQKKKPPCFGKMAVTFAYDLRWKSFLYEKDTPQKVTSEFNRGNPVVDF